MNRALVLPGNLLRRLAHEAMDRVNDRVATVAAITRMVEAMVAATAATTRRWWPQRSQPQPEREPAA
jgi:hypothetical protein